MTVDEALDLRQQTAEAVQHLAGLLKALPDKVYNGAFLDEVLTLPLLKALQDPAEIRSFPTFAAFFTARRDRLAFVERMRVALHRSYAFEAKTKEGKKLFISVSGQQWFDDGVMHTEGEREHEGFMLLLQDGVIKCATIAREAKEGDELGPEDFRYISVQEANARQKTMPANQIANIEQPLRDLEALIARQESDETQYQELFERYPWVLGTQYSQAFRHKPLDNENIPDFLAQRSRDGRHDIIEIKPPTLNLARSNGSPNATCRDAIAQCERYLDFARTNAAYLAGRRLNMNAPECWLIAGHRISDDVRTEFRTKQRCNPALHILTYEDLIMYMKGTINLLKGLRDGTIKTPQPSDDDGSRQRGARPSHRKKRR